MKLRNYFSAIIVLLILFGISKEQFTKPNQEIVLQFSDTEVSSKDTKNAVESIKLKLQGLNVQDLQVKQLENGQLKIVYFSKVHINEIKQLLHSDGKIAFNQAIIDHENQHPENPSDKNSSSYSLNIYEIQNSNSSESGIGGKFVLEKRQEIDRVLNPNINLFINKRDGKETIELVHTSPKLNRDVTIVISNRSYTIPEVRAGPNC